MDTESASLIGAHGYCSQEMVNLLLTGQAVSNTFDGYLILDESGVVSKNNGLIMTGYFSYICIIFVVSGQLCTFYDPIIT